MDVQDSRAAQRCVDTLLERYPTLAPEESSQAVVRAQEALALFGLIDDPDADALWVACADREVRLRLGLDVEVARLDPQSHPGRRTVASEC